MTLITDILDLDQLSIEIGAGYVTERQHPDFPEIAILNYTDRCQFDRRWNDVTRHTRGLIFNRASGEILARPFAKFFNYGDEHHTGALDPDMPILGAWDKIDGSLGIQYRLPDGRQAIATRGSFTSDQALHATKRLRETGWDIMPDDFAFTWLWEIVYPGNRIVVDYGDRDELVYLGAVGIEHGEFLPPDTPSLDGFSVAERMIDDNATLRDVLELPPRPNAEGVVVWLDPHHAVKIKQEDYVELHRVVSHLTVKEVWRQLRAGSFLGFVTSLPDEFHDWALDAAAPLMTDYALTVWAAELWLERVREDAGATRKEQALWIQANVSPAMRGLVFALLDGKSIDDAVWRMVEPKGDQPARAFEDAA